MHTKLTRFLMIAVLALVLGSATAAPVAAQSTRHTNEAVEVLFVMETFHHDREARTITVETTTYYSDGTWSQVTETWSYIE